VTLRASRHLLGLACAAAVVSTSGLAAANGRYPGADEFLVSPKSASTYVVHGSFGLLVSNDAGKKWSWICDDVIEPSLAGDSISPSVVVFESGAIAVSSPSGIRRSTDGGCSFAPAPGTEGLRIRDIAKERGTPRAVAITAPADGTPPEILETTDDGVSWHKVGVSLPPELVPQNVELAQGAPSRLYASGTAQFSYDDAGLADAGIPGNRVGVMYASDDRGQTWRRTFVPEAYSIASDVYISAVDPANPDLVYARSGFQVSPTSRDAVVLVSRDGAKTYEVVFRANKASLPGFALSPDGSKIALGVTDANGDNGTWIASRDTMKFEKHAPDVLSCLTWGADSLFACQNLFTPACNPTCPYVVASSKNDARTWDPLLVKLSDVDGPLACPQASPFTSMCIPVWENNWKCKLEGCDAAAPSDAGRGDAGEPGIPSGVVGPDGCSCGQTPGARAAGTGLSVIASALGLAAVVARLRRRR
jgi:photosystem II stability/assembly factor-like uncharacterized protein